MAKLGGVTLHIEREDENHRVDVTEYAVEKGVPFTDHVSKRSPEFIITGYIISKKFETDKTKLIDIMNKGKIVKYVGKMSASNVVITNISGAHSSTIKNGMTVIITLKRIRIATTSWKKKKPIQKKPTESGKKKPVSKKPPSKKKYHVVKAGDTYWALARKYGTTVNQLRAWNKYPDRRIPQKVKLRVK